MLVDTAIRTDGFRGARESISVLLLTEMCEGTDSAGELFSVVGEIKDISLILDGSCLRVEHFSSASCFDGENGETLRIISLTGDAVLHQLLLGRNDESNDKCTDTRSGDVFGKLLLNYRLGGGFKGDYVMPNEQQLMKLIKKHLLSRMEERSDGDEYEVLKFPQWFLYLSGDSALPVCDIIDPVLKSMLQQRPGIVLWFRHIIPFSASSDDLPSPMATSLFSKWWRDLQRALLLPSAMATVDHLLLSLSSQKSFDYITDACVLSNCLCFANDTKGRWHFDFGLEKISAATDVVSQCSVACEQTSLHSTNREDLRSLPEQQCLSETHYFEDVSALLAMGSSAELSAEQQRCGPDDIQPQLQLQAIREHAAHFFLFVFADTKAASSSPFLGKTVLFNEQTLNGMWYVQLVMQHTEAGGSIVSAFGSSPQLRFTPFPDAASRFVLLGNNSQMEELAGWRMHSVDYPGVVLECVLSTNRRMLLPMFLITQSPSPYLRVVSTSAATGEMRETVLAPDSSVLLQRSVASGAKTKFYLENVSLTTEKSQFQEIGESYWKICLSFTNDTNNFYMAVGPDFSGLVAVSSSTPSDSFFLPVYASLTPFWRARMAVERHPHYFGMGITTSHHSSFLLLPPAGLNSLRSRDDFFFLSSSLAGRVASLFLSFSQVPVVEKPHCSAPTQCNISSFAPFAASPYFEPLNVVFVGSSSVGRTMMVQWLWAWSQGCGNEAMLQTLYNWFRRGGSDDEKEEEQEEEEAFTKDVFSSPTFQFGLLNDKKVKTTSAQESQRVELVVAGQTHIFDGDAAKFLLRSFTGINEVVLHLKDYGVPLTVKIVDVPDSSSRELLRTHCVNADVVVCVVDMCDRFSLVWLEEQLDVILSGFIIRKKTQLTKSLLMRYMQQRQKLVFLKLNDASSHQMIYSREIKQFFAISEQTAGVPIDTWVSWAIPCAEKMNDLQRSEVLYESFVDLLQERHACRLTAFAMGWENDVVAGIRKFARGEYHCFSVVCDNHADVEGLVLGEGKLVALNGNKLSTEVTNCGLFTLSSLLSDRIVAESEQGILATEFTARLPFWLRLLRWLLIGFCILDPLAQYLLLALRTDTLNKNKRKEKHQNIGAARNSIHSFANIGNFSLSAITSARLHLPLTLEELSKFFVAFYSLERQTVLESLNSHLAVTLAACAMARRAFVNISPATVGIWFGRTLVLTGMESCSVDESQLFISFLLLWINNNLSTMRITRQLWDASFDETVLMSLTVLRLLHDPSTFFGELSCGRQPPEVVASNAAYSVSSLREVDAACLQSGTVEACQAALTCAVADAVGERLGAKAEDNTATAALSSLLLLSLVSQREVGIVGEAGPVSTFSNTLYSFGRSKRKPADEMSVAKVARQLRKAWPTEDVNYSLDWRNAWTREDEGKFVSTAHRAIQGYEKRERRLCQQLYGDEALRRFAPPTRAYVVKQPGFARVDVELEVAYSHALEENEFAPF